MPATAHQEIIKIVGRRLGHQGDIPASPLSRFRPSTSIFTSTLSGQGSYVKHVPDGRSLWSRGPC